MVSMEMLSLLVLVPCAAAASSCGGSVVVVVVVVVSAEVALVSSFFFATMRCGVSNRRVGTKLLVESVSGWDEYHNSKEMRTERNSRLKV